MSALHDLIQQQVAAATVTTISRTAQRIGEELAEEILRDAEFRATIRDLARAAFQKALTELQA